LVLHRKLIRALDSSKKSRYRRGCRSPGLGQCSSSKIFHQNYISMSPGGATIEAAENLKAQLYSQSKIATPRRENRKILNEIEIL
jgi:hypothetical protein